MNLNNSLRRVPVVGPRLNQLLHAPSKRGSRVGVSVAANAVTVYAGPYSFTVWPGGRGVNRYEHYVRGEGGWFRSLSRTTRFGHFMANLDRTPNWRNRYR